ncbi:MAG: LAGLIDADG family homing endonuclease [Candidatus Colwellbacteria bacterium]|nr:LAGLIDADG family homing endonuclease [Candidatus Colwellbacteria bacterium]
MEGEGCFCITISKHKTKRSGIDPRLMFEVEMVIEDKPLLEKLQATLGCGHVFVLNYERYGWRPHAKFAVKSHGDIIEKIIPFFKKYPLAGKKRLDFSLFCQASGIFSRREHLSKEGIEKLKDIQSRMNLRRRLKQLSARVRENRAPGGEKPLTSDG